MDQGAIINNKIQTYKLIIAYDGTKYYGWQKQDGGNAFIWIGGVADTLIRSFKKVFLKEISILGASRTDKGVHAHGQVARIRTILDLDPTKIMTAWNYHLPSDITIKSASKAADLFNPRKDVKQKTYTYRLFTEYPDPFIGRFGWLYPFIKAVDINTLKKVLALYVGKHDFSSFCRYQEAKSPIKIIDSIEFVYEKTSTPSYLITIKGPSFAHHQI
ncbi:tRNA pseudouridine synthase A, partial [Candidatus Babeliales bacterium]|nr:tRNA pseudouridine synthase A [Candidatus Babeliales bacterium]